MTTAVIYVAHPVGHPPEREANLARARRWLLWLIRTYPDRAFVMPWLPYCELLDETDENRKRGIRDDLAALRRCDAVWLVGGRVSVGMAMEAEHARADGLGVLDLTGLGEEPPPESGWRMVMG